MGRRLRAIDVYSGVGGWTLGLRMAGLNVVASYEKWPEANSTNWHNNGHHVPVTDIRKLQLKNLPTEIDVVVGSPPCVEFSYSNRGGNGDIADGLRDIRKFLAIVDHLKPKAWAMENVPRIGEILERELTAKGRLARFRHLGVDCEILNCEDFGVPQRRLRCIAGNLNFKLIQAYAKSTKRLSLGAVIEALNQPRVTDPIYGGAIDRGSMFDHELEDPLDSEEERINRAAKLLHPVYNKMAFPDPLDRSVRTVTATCTRVSRESVVVEDPNSPGQYRRLTLRERSSLQGFPVTFNFYGSNYGNKLRMIGNAMPPLLAFYIGQSIRRIPAAKTATPEHAINVFSPSGEAPSVTPPSKAVGLKFPKTRGFRFAIPSLHFKSGVRFEIRNTFKRSVPQWHVAFVFGSPQSIHEMPLTADVSAVAMKALSSECRDSIQQSVATCCTWVKAADVRRMQDLWSHRGPGLTRPFLLVDQVDGYASTLTRIIAESTPDAASALDKVIAAAFGRKAKKLVGLGKLQRNAPAVLAGILLGAGVNVELDAHRRGTQAEPSSEARTRIRRQASTAAATFQ